MRPDLEIIAYGIPGPQGSKRHVGGGRMIESSKKVKPWRDAVWCAAWEVLRIRAKVTGPVRCAMHFTMPRPKSAKAGAVPSTRPDLSKLIRSTEDALTDAGAWEDDGRVVEISATKRYIGDGDTLSEPGCDIRIWSLR